MNISLRRGERIFINGAVIRVDRKVCLELLNDVTFLLEHHIIQSDEANTPLKQLYLAVQTILMAPTDGDASLAISLSLIKNYLLITNDNQLIHYLIEVKNYLEMNRPFEALKSLRNVLQSNVNQASEWDYKLGKLVI